MSDEIKNVAEAIERLTRSSQPLIDGPRGDRFVAVPADFRLHRIEPLEEALPYVRQTEHLLSVASFCEYVNRFRTPETSVFGDYRKPGVRAVFDYHVPADRRHTAQHCAHVAEYNPPWSEAWARWRAIDGQEMSQTGFAEFVEENYADIAEPDHAALLDMVSNLSAVRKGHFSSGVRLQNGANELSFSEDIEAKVGKNKVVVPSEITLGVPVLFGGAAYKVRAMLRYRAKDGLTFIVKINRRLFVEQQAFSDVLAAIESATGVKPYEAA
jgi:uncharacterized protein YfdQ (DUF2303 family)